MSARQYSAWLCLAVAALWLSVGVGQARERTLDNRNGVQARDLDPAEKGLVTGVGIEAHDIQSMTNQMARDMFASGFLNGLASPPRILIDEQEFRNEGSQIINRRMITQRLMTELNRAAQGRMSFVGQRYAGMVAKQRELKREGVTDVGTTGMTGGQAGVDYFLGGAIMTLDSRDPRSGVIQRYNQIAFDLVDAESGSVVWSGMYEFQRAAADDIIYR
ncbi:penicillin-binding protein activator LpoB [Pseudoxanthomonas dokdonensis]|uniref:penicillin-binding protein activator LpoB n=1 Tax=Pseudoxanthomonas dokdonensis TaxID=344882 RepID=UPI00070FB1D6|nr:penicillin-binding protein activator LpoB [Pseudoxanthomonas dokdonensis]